MSDRDLPRWTREVAEDPGAPAFVRLARVYRKQGHRQAAREVVMRGLERSPRHVDAHALLALLLVEDGDRAGAQDAWETVLRLEPASFDARRGLGFLALERRDLAAARRHLDAAHDARPDDPAVAQARDVLARREAASADRIDPDLHDPVRLFQPLDREAPFRGGLLLDGQGLVLAGSLGDAPDRADLLGALMSTAVGEAARTAELIRIGDWGSLVLECDDVVLHVGRLDGGCTVVLAADRDAPAGWVARTADRVRSLGRRFLEANR
jgi:predicted regulator of Ras-like GTPase activity (Roadblock/LC7/MglB family)